MSQNDVPSWIGPVARAGHAAKGIIYATVGILAVLAAFGGGGQTTGSKGAIAEIGSQPFGRTLLGILAVGLLCYAVWRFLSAFLDAEGKGSDAKALATRTGFFFSALAHLGLMATAGMIAVRGFGGNSGESNAQDLTAKLMELPFGPALVFGVGVVFGIVGLAQIGKAITGAYRSKFALDDAAASQRQWIDRAAKLGLSARGVVFLILAFFLTKAGIQSDSSEARGFGGALDALVNRPYGPWLLGAVAVGLICYGFYCGILSRYGHFARATS